MTIHELDSLLMRIRDKEASNEDVRRARELVQIDERLPEELREIALVEDIREDAVALLAVLGHDDGFGALVGEALLSEVVESSVESNTEVHEAQVVDLAEAMEEELARPFPWPLAEALQADAGRVEVVDAVLESLELESGVSAMLAASSTRRPEILTPYKPFWRHLESRERVHLSLRRLCRRLDVLSSLRRSLRSLASRSIRRR